MAFIVGAVIGAGAAIAGGAISASGAKKAGNIAAAGSAREIEFNRESRDLARADQAPYREAGYEALDALRSLTGLAGTGKSVHTGSPPATAVPVPAGFAADGRRWIGSRSGSGVRSSSYGEDVPQLRYAGGPTQPDMKYNVSELGPENYTQGGSVTRPQNPATIDGATGYVDEGNAVGNDTYGGKAVINANPNTANSTAINPATGYPNENPGGQEGGYNFMTDPGYQFRFEEGQRALDRGAAARGGLLSGGYARKAIRYGQDYASNEYSNVYNRIANIAGLGQTANNASGQYAMQAGQNMGTAAAQGGYARASGYQAAGNAWANAGNQIAQLPWGQAFNNGSPNPGVPA